MDEFQQNIDVEIDLDAIIDALCSSQAFLDKLSLALTKQARGVGNLYGKWGQKQPAPIVNPPKAIRRLN